MQRILCVVYGNQQSKSREEQQDCVRDKYLLRMALSRISEEDPSQKRLASANPFQMQIEEMKNSAVPGQGSVDIPITLGWRNIVYSVTYAAKKIKQSHLDNTQHDESRRALSRRQLFKVEEEVGAHEQLDEDPETMRKPLLNGRKSSRRLKTQGQVDLFDTVFIDQNISREHQDQTLPVLKKLTGIAKPFELIGILGPSGCGKTSLLNVLSCREAPGKYGNLSGQILINGQTMTKERFGQIGAFVQQDDILLATMTPVQCFTFGANLKLKDLNPQQRAARVNKLITDLRLQKCKNTRVGNVLMRGLSGGERKRTSIGYELITNPSLLYLDEPTSGIDSYTSLGIVELLHRQARQGRTIVATIHQPSADIFMNFDKILLMSRGHFTYFGPPDQVMKYMSSIGFRHQKFINPADFIMKVSIRPDLCNPVSSKCLDRNYLNQQYDELLAGDINAELDRNSNFDGFDFAMVKQDSTPPFFTQFNQLYRRHLTNILRNPILFRVKIFQAAFTLFFAASLWWETGNHGQDLKPERIFNIIGLTFFLSNNLIFPTTLGIILNFPSQEAVYRRESLKRLYGPTAFYWSVFFVEFIFFQVYPLIISFVYFFIDIKPSADAYFLLLASGFTMITIGLSLGYAFSMMCKGEDSARFTVMFLLLFFMLGSGILVNLTSLRAWLIWLEYISIIRYNMEIFMRAMIFNFSDPSQKMILDQFKYNLGFATCFGINIGIAGFFLLVGWLALTIRTKYI